MTRNGRCVSDRSFGQCPYDCPEETGRKQEKEPQETPALSWQNTIDWDEKPWFGYENMTQKLRWEKKQRQHNRVSSSVLPTR